MLNYKLSSGPKTYAAHNEFTVSTVPITHTLCGSLSYSGTFEGSPPSSLVPISNYNVVTRQFTADSTDNTLKDTTRQYEVHAEFTAYPQATYSGVSVADSVGPITFEGNCDAAVLTPTP